MKPWLLFDFDGTVANSIDKILELINELAPRHGYAKITPEKFAAIRNLPITRAVRSVKMPLYKLGRAISIILNEYRRIVPDLEPCAGIIPVLNDLKAAGISLALISSNHTENLRAFLDHHQIGCFDWVEGTSGILKKHNNILRQIRKHNLDKGKVIYVGDEARDIKAARRSEVKIISVAWGLHTAEHLQKFKPDYLVRAPNEILTIVKELALSGEDGGR